MKSHMPILTAASAVMRASRLNQPAIQPQPRPPNSAAHSHGPPARGKADTTWPIVSATTRENKQNNGQPTPIEAPPTLQNPVWKEVIPPARIQIRDMVRAKLAN